MANQHQGSNDLFPEKLHAEPRAPSERRGAVVGWRRRKRGCPDKVAPLRAAGLEQWQAQPLRIPEFVVYHSVVLGVAGFVAAAALWSLKRWNNVWLTVIVCVLGILSAAPGFTEAPNSMLRIRATGAVVGGALIILLVVLLNLRRVYTKY